MPAELDKLIADLTTGISTKNSKLYMKCIDSENPEFYAEQQHMFQDTEALNISDFKLKASDSSKFDDGSWLVSFEQSWSIGGSSHRLKYQGIFKNINGAYKFSDLNFDSLITDHFIIKYSPSLIEQAKSLSTFVEEAYVNLKNVYDRVPAVKTVVKLYDDNEVFNWFIKPSINFNMLGWYEYPESIKINMNPTTPKRIGDAKFKEVYLGDISHEFIHRITIAESGNNMPYWMVEGLASYLGRKGKLDLSPPQKNIEQLEKINLDKLTDNTEITQFYKDSYLNICRLVDKFGVDKFYEILSELGKYPLQQKTIGQSIDENNALFHEVLKSHMSMTVEEFDNLFK